MGTGRRRISLADVVRVTLAAGWWQPALVAPEDPVELAVRAALVVPEDPVVPAVRVALVVPEDPAVRAALVVPEDPAVPVALVVPAVRAALVVSESPAVPVALERELVQVEAVLVQGHRPAQLAVAPRTKSVIAAHHPDLAPLLEAAVDLVAVAETTRAPAAAEAVKAWEVAVTAVAAEVSAE